MTKEIRVGINGPGRIGIQLIRQIYSGKHPNITVVGLNGHKSPEEVAYALQYDSVHGRFDGKVCYDNSSGIIIVNGDEIRVSNQDKPCDIEWASVGAEYVIEGTGKFLTAEQMSGHITAGAKKVLLTAPAKDNTPMFVMGVNHEKYEKSMTFFSNASCTTNCLAPIAKVLNDQFRILEGLMTTVHAATSSQKVLDGSSKKDPRSGRAVFNNIIPASTGAAKAVGKVIPELKGKLTGMACRVPVSDVSMVDLVVKLKTPTSLEEICNVMRLASHELPEGTLFYNDLPLVSSDFIGDLHGAIFDAGSSMELNETFFKIVAWYDNEVGYTARALALLEYAFSVDHS